MSPDINSQLSSMYTNKLDECNYSTWKLRMRMVLIKEILWEYVNKETASDSTEDKKHIFNLKGEEALASIVLSLDDNQFSIIRNAESCRDA